MDMHFEGIVFHTYADELARRLEHAHPPFAVLDVRSKGERERRRIAGSLRADAASLIAFPAGTDEKTEFFLVGADHKDGRVRQAALALKTLKARRVVEVTGGLLEWVRRGLPWDSGREAA